MEEQGAIARQSIAAIFGNLDDENSQAEGFVVCGNAGNLNTNHNSQLNQQHLNYPVYENIYEPINNPLPGSGGAAVAVVKAIVPADETHSQHSSNENINPINNYEKNVNASTHQQHRTFAINYPYDLYDRSNTQNNAAAYDVPRSARAGLGLRRNNPLESQGSNRFSGIRCSVGVGNNSNRIYANAYQRQHSLDDTVSQNYYNLNYQNRVRCDNIYEQILDEPMHYSSSSGGRICSRLNVIGHGIGRIERHLSSSCGNIDHYNLGSHYAVLGHSQFGTMGHIRLNDETNINCSIPNTTTDVHPNTSNVTTHNFRDPGSNIKCSAASFFSCLQGENSHSVNFLNRSDSTANITINSAFKSASASPVTTTSNITSLRNTIHSNIEHERTSERAARASSPPNLNLKVACSLSNETSGINIDKGRATGAIPKNRALNINGGKNNNLINAGSTYSLEKSVFLLKNSSNKNINSSAQTTNSNTELNTKRSLNRISKASLQWLLVNKWMPLWIDQGSNCKVIDFNFMFSRDCVGCDEAAAATSMSRPYVNTGDIVHFNRRSEFESPCMPTSLRRSAPPIKRPLHNALNRLRNNNDGRESVCNNEDLSYENVHVQWQNGFEFRCSRDFEPSSSLKNQHYQHQQRPQFYPARSESPTVKKDSQRKTMRSNFKSSSNQFSDPIRNYELNIKCSAFKSKGVVGKQYVCEESMNFNHISTNTNNLRNFESLPSTEVTNDEVEGAVGGCLFDTANTIKNELATGVIKMKEPNKYKMKEPFTAAIKDKPIMNNLSDETDLATFSTTSRNEKQSDKITVSTSTEENYDSNNINIE